MSLVHLDDTFHIAGVTPQECFDYITDVDNGAEWNTFVRSATAEGDLDVGRVIHAQIQFLIPLPFTINSEVTTCEVPSAYTITSHFPFDADLGAKMAEEGNGTAFTFFLDMKPTRFFPVPKVVLKKALRVQFDRDKKLLRERLQALAG